MVDYVSHCVHFVFVVSLHMIAIYNLHVKSKRYYSSAHCTLMKW